jgi:hypothetical protein
MSKITWRHLWTTSLLLRLKWKWKGNVKLKKNCKKWKNSHRMEGKKGKLRLETIFKIGATPSNDKWNFWWPNHRLLLHFQTPFHSPSSYLSLFLHLYYSLLLSIILSLYFSLSYTRTDISIHTHTQATLDTHSQVFYSKNVTQHFPPNFLLLKIVLMRSKLNANRE